MEDTINTMEDFKKLASHSFYVVHPSKTWKGKGTVKIPVDTYAELSYFLLDTIKVCVAARDAEHESVTAVRNVSSAVSGVLEKLLDIIPLEEIDLLDKIRDMVDDKVENADRGDS